MPLYCVDKPLGLSSHDVVARARRLLGTRRVGHAGTLDPLATGVLLVLSQEATKLSQFVTGHDKSYLAWVTFGASTPTLDAEGPVVREADATALTAEAIAAAFGPFLSLAEQRPPAFSAIKRAGERSYAAARRGELEEPPARPAGYRRISLLGLARDRADLPQRFSPAQAARAVAGPGEGGAAGGEGQGEAAPQSGDWRPDPAGRAFELPPPLPVGAGMTAVVALRVAAGTYVRAFARDLGESLGLPAHLSGLVRTASGRVDLSQATSLERLAEAPELPLGAALDLPRLGIDEATAVAVRQGKRPPLELSGRTALLSESGELVAVVDPDDAGGYRVARVFVAGD